MKGFLQLGIPRKLNLIASALVGSRPAALCPEKVKQQYSPASSGNKRKKVTNVLGVLLIEANDKTWM